MKRVEWKLKEHKARKSLCDIDEVCSQLVYSLFSDEIEMTIPMWKFVTSWYTSYWGTKDPIAHVLSFKHSMTSICLHMSSKDMMMYKMLASMLQDNTMKWLNDLPMWSISSFVELVRAFVTHYVSNKPKRKSHTICFPWFMVKRKLLKFT